MVTYATEGSEMFTLPVELSLDFLRKITDYFSEERILSTNAFGTHYKGIFEMDGETEIISVKRLGKNALVLDNKVFNKAVYMMELPESANILKLNHYCHEGKKQVVQRNGRYVIEDIVESLLCYEYMSNGRLDKYIFGGPDNIDWATRFEIIKGICNGLLFLHNNHIVHMDLKPENILLNNEMMPKIANFGHSRIYCQDQTKRNTNFGGYEYTVPEYLYRREIPTQLDIYSLGLVIIETTTGEKNNSAEKNEPTAKKFIEEIREKWTLEHITSVYRNLSPNGMQEVKKCIEIGLDCAQFIERNRPPIETVVRMLKIEYLETRSGSTSLLNQLQPPELRTTMLNEEYPETRSGSTSLLNQLQPPELRTTVWMLNKEYPETRSGSTSLLNQLQPPELRFTCEPKRLPSCSFNLTNNTDDHIAFKLVTKQTIIPKRYLTELPIYGIVPPKCTYTLSVIMREQKKPPPSNSDDFLTVLQRIIARNEDIENVDPASVSGFLEAAGDEVEEEKVAVICEPPKSQSIQSATEIIASRNYRQMLSVDIHQTEPWILTSNKGGYACIWNYRTRAEVETFEVSEEGEPVYSAKFIARGKWLVVGRSDGYIYVYDYDTVDHLKSVEAHAGPVTSLAVYPTHSFVLSASDDHLIKLWEWSKDWECTQTFEGHRKRITKVMFDPNDSNCFASASMDGTVKIWNSSAGTCIITLDGHPDGQLCLHYFTSLDRQLLVSGSSDGAAKIWDLQTDNCISTLEGHGNHLSAIFWHPELSVLMTGSLDGTVRVLKSTNTTYRLENIISFNLGAVNALGYIKGLKRIVAGCDQGVAMMEINLSRRPHSWTYEDYIEEDTTKKWNEKKKKWKKARTIYIRLVKKFFSTSE